MMTCMRVRELLLAYLDQELTQAERIVADVHLGTCAECRAELEAMDGTRRTVGVLVAGGALGEDFATRVADEAERAGAFDAAGGAGGAGGTERTSGASVSTPGASASPAGSSHPAAGGAARGSRAESTDRPPLHRLAIAAAVFAAFALYLPFVSDTREPVRPAAAANRPDTARDHAPSPDPEASSTPTGAKSTAPSGGSGAAQSGSAATTPGGAGAQPTPFLDPVPASAARAADARLETRVFTQKSFHAGTRASLRVLARDWKSETPIAGAAVDIRLVTLREDGFCVSPQEVDVLLQQGVTDTRGTVPASFLLPDLPAGRYALDVRTTLGTRSTHILHPVEIRRDCAVLISTDKPSYQPSQTIHVRAMVLRVPSHRPVEGVPITLEIEDPNGNRIHREKAVASAHGLADTRLTLAHEIRLGAYTITARAEVDGKPIESKKPVAVDRYSLPKFKITAKLDREAYRPGERMKGSIQADYFFGEPVVGAEVEAVAEWSDAAGKSFFKATATTDAHGSCELPEIPLPGDRKAGTAVLALTLRDPGKQTERVQLTALVSTGELGVTAFVEGGEVVPGMPNRLWVVAQYPDATPAQVEVTVELPGGPRTVKTDAQGLADLEWTDDAEDDESQRTVRLSARDARGNLGEGTATLPRRDPGPALRVALDRAAYSPGEPLLVRAEAVECAGPVYVDVVRNGQVVLTRSMDLVGGAATMRIDLPADVTGVVEVLAYGVAQKFRRVWDARRAFVTPAEDLAVEVELDRESYRPGEVATLEVQVRDREGRPAPAALGLWVVDPAVLARADYAPGLAKTLYLLEREVLQPRMALPGMDPDKALFAEDAAKRDRAARALFAACDMVQRITEAATSREADVVAEMRADAQELAAAAGRWLEEERKRVRADEIVADWKALEERRKDVLLSPGERMMLTHAILWKAVLTYRSARRPKLDNEMKRLIEAGLVDETDLLDLWGRPYTLGSFCFCGSEQYPHELVLQSRGPDGLPANADDIQVTPGGFKGEVPEGIEARVRRAGLPLALLRDPWRTRYRVEGDARKGAVDLHSAGPDREFGTRDDLTCRTGRVWSPSMSSVPAAWLKAQGGVTQDALMDPFDGEYGVRTEVTPSGIRAVVVSAGADGRMATLDDLTVVNRDGTSRQEIASRAGRVIPALGLDVEIPGEWAGPGIGDEDVRELGFDGEVGAVGPHTGDLLVARAMEDGGFPSAPGTDMDPSRMDAESWLAFLFAGMDGRWEHRSVGIGFDSMPPDPNERDWDSSCTGFNVDYNIDERSLFKFIYAAIYGGGNRESETRTAGIGLDYYISSKFEDYISFYGDGDLYRDRLRERGGLKFTYNLDDNVHVDYFWFQALETRRLAEEFAGNVYYGHERPIAGMKYTFDHEIKPWIDLNFTYISGNDADRSRRDRGSGLEWDTKMTWNYTESLDFDPGWSFLFYGDDGWMDSPSKNHDFVAYEDNDATMILEENHFGLDLDISYWKIQSGMGSTVTLEDQRAFQRATKQAWADLERFDVGTGVGGAGSGFIDLPRVQKSGELPRNAAQPAIRPTHVRVRRHFPETLFVAPQVLTDAEGRARVTVRLADTITKWVAAAVANTRDGRLGSAHRPITVFQEFFLDVGLPPYVTQHDILDVPVSVMNYLEEAQDVHVALAPSDRYEALGAREADLRVEAGKVAGAVFRIRALRPGLLRLRVDGHSGQAVDAMERVLEVLPDGREGVFTASQFLEGAPSFPFTVPASAVEGGSTLVVRLYPGCFSQVVEGMDSMLHVPCG